ncbi:hypothetical protein HQ535_03785 [bacterium]|nr:hypothetical protein [bacterium]
MRFALLGDPVAHSRSPAIQAAALRSAGIEGRYEARQVDASGVHRACAEMRAGHLDGANVTMPHKHEAAAAADRLIGPALRGMAVNTLVASDGEVEGHTTDVPAVVDIWARCGLPLDAPVLILGSGGAATAALLALEGRDLAISARSVEAITTLVDSLDIDANPHPWGRPLDGAVVVNATPIGMEGESLPDGVLAVASGLLDMAYGPDPTPAVALALTAGTPVADGLDMLVAQAARSFTLWTGCSPDLEAMQAAARR